jgi:BlaI family transcriptional regulator, penicillinase repressor
MKRKPSRPVRLSAGELQLMALLWDRGPLTLAEAHAAFGEYGAEVSYPTMQTRLNRLVEKQVARRSDERPATYEAGITRNQVAAGHLDQLLDAVGRANVIPLVAHLLSERPLTDDERAQLERLLKEHQSAGKRTSRRGSS